ncbi:MAG: hypothetical protein R3B07_27300 [Polyangiaceae bacterium]
MPETIANGGKSPWVPMYSPVGQTLGGSAVSSSREGRSKLGATLVAVGGVAVLGIAAVVWFMTRPVPTESVPQVAAPTQEGLSVPAPVDPAETAAASEPTVEPAAEPSAEASAAPSASAEPPAAAVKAPAVRQQQKPATKSTATGTSDADNMLKYRK